MLSIHRTETAADTNTTVALDTEKGHEILPLPTPTVGWEVTWVDEFLRGVKPTISAEYAQVVTRVCLAAIDSSSKGSPVAL